MHKIKNIINNIIAITMAFADGTPFGKKEGTDD